MCKTQAQLHRGANATWRPVGVILAYSHTPVKSILFSISSFSHKKPGLAQPTMGEKRLGQLSCYHLVWHVEGEPHSRHMPASGDRVRKILRDGAATHLDRQRHTDHLARFMQQSIQNSSETICSGGTLKSASIFIVARIMGSGPHR